MYSTPNEEKSVIAETFIRILKNKNCKYMTSVSKNDMVNQYNNTYINIIKMKPVDVKSSTYIHSNKEINDQHPKFKIGDTVRISKYKTVFAKDYTPNCSEKIFEIKKVKNTVPWTCY